MITALLTLVIITTGWFIAGFRPEVAQWSVLALGTLLAIEGGYLVLQKKDTSLHLYSFLFLPVLAYILISTFWITPTKWLGLRDFYLFFQAFVVFFLVAQNATSYRLYWVFAVGLAGLGLLEVGAAIYQYKVEAYWLPMDYKLPVYSGRSSGTFGNPGHFAAFLSLLFFPTLALLLKAHVKKWQRFILLILLAAWTIGLLLASSRGALLGIFVGICFMPVLFCGSIKKRVHTWALIILILAGLHVGASYALDVYKRRDVFNLNYLREDTRWVQWKAAYAIFLENPVLGSGAGSYDIYFEKYRPKNYLHTPVWVHNEFLNILSDYGILGFCLFFIPGAFVFSLCFLDFWRLPSGQRCGSNTSILTQGILLALLAFSVHTLFDFTFRIPTLFFTFTLFLALLATRVFPPRFVPKNACRWIGLGCLLLGIIVPIYAVPKYRAADLQEKVSHKMSEIFVSPDQLQNLPAVLPDLIQNLKKAIRLDPDNPEPWSSLSLAYYYLSKELRSGDYIEQANLAAQDAVSAGFRATELCPGEWFFWVSYGLALSLENQFLAGQSAMKTAVDLAPNESMAWYYYALFLSTDKSRPDRTIEALDKALEINRFNHRALTLKSHVLGQM